MKRIQWSLKRYQNINNRCSQRFSGNVVLPVVQHNFLVILSIFLSGQGANHSPTFQRHLCLLQCFEQSQSVKFLVGENTVEGRKRKDCYNDYQIFLTTVFSRITVNVTYGVTLIYWPQKVILKEYFLSKIIDILKFCGLCIFDFHAKYSNIKNKGEFFIYKLAVRTQPMFRFSHFQYLDFTYIQLCLQPCYLQMRFPFRQSPEALFVVVIIFSFMLCLRYEVQYCKGMHKLSQSQKE